MDRDYDTLCLDEIAADQADGLFAIDEGPWSGSASNYSDTQYQAACALDRKGCGGKYASMPPKERCSLPYKTPSGEVSRRGVHAAAQRLGSVTDVCPSAVASAKSKLRAAYKQLGETPPDSLKGEADVSVVSQDDPRVLAGVALLDTEGHTWALREEMLDTISALHGKIVSVSAVNAAIEARGKVGGVSVAAGGTAVIPIHGVVTPRTSLISLLFGGGGGLDMLRAQVTNAMNDGDVKSIVFDVDSPGGMVDQVPETAALIRQAREVKPTVAVANTTAGSAAYWLASQAHEVVATPSAEVGSIGAYNIHKDMSKALEGQGINMTLIKAGKYKAEDTPFAPLSSDATQARQQMVDDFYTQFVNDVAAGRGVTPEDVQGGYGEGRALGAKRAKSAGLVDRIATLDETVSRLASGRARVKDPTASAGEEDTPIEANGEISPEDKTHVAEVLASLA